MRWTGRVVRYKLGSLALAIGFCFFVIWCARAEQKKEAAPGPASGGNESIEILYTRDLYGHADLCGCSPAQQGGLPRLSTFFRERQTKDPTALRIKVDCGNFLPKMDDPAQQIHIAEMLDGYAALKYDAINLGTVEAGHRPAVLQTLRAASLPITSASLLDSNGKSLFPPFIVKERNGVKMAFIGIVGKKPTNGEVTILEPADALGRALSAVAAEKPALRIVLGDLETDAAIALANQFKEVNVILSAKDLHITPRTSAHIAPWNGQYGKNAGLALLKYKDGAMSFRASFYPLSSEVASDEAIKKVVEDARVRAEAQLKIRPHQVKDLDKWVGSTRCQECHAPAVAVWKASQHHDAIKILKEKDAATRLDCVSCHVTGYNVATAAYLEESVGCEACHGPGKDHVEYFAGKVKEFPSMKATSSVCVKCHNEPNSPLFSFAYYWEKIKH